MSSKVTSTFSRRARSAGLMACVISLAPCAAGPPDAPPQTAPSRGGQAPVVQIVENWAEVEGVVEEVQPADSGAALVTLRIDRVAPVERSRGTFYPNFAEGREGTVMGIRLPEPAVRKAKPARGDTLKVRVRRGSRPDEFFAHPDEIEVVRRQER